MEIIRGPPAIHLVNVKQGNFKLIAEGMGDTLVMLKPINHYSSKLGIQSKPS